MSCKQESNESSSVVDNNAAKEDNSVTVNSNNKNSKNNFHENEQKPQQKATVKKPTIKLVVKKRKFSSNKRTKQLGRASRPTLTSLSPNKVGTRHGTTSRRRGLPALPNRIVVGNEYNTTQLATTNNNTSVSFAPQVDFLQPQSVAARSIPLSNNNPSVEEEEEEGDPHLSMLFEDLPCDTLLAIRSLVKGGQCLHCPLFCPTKLVSTIPCVLESQLYSTLQGMADGSDSVVGQELAMLIATNQVRRLSMANQTCDTVCIIMEAKHYQTAIWDAFRHYQQQQKQKQEQQQQQPTPVSTQSTTTIGTSSIAQIVTSWFTSSLSQWTGRIIAADVLHESWRKYQITPRTNKNNGSPQQQSFLVVSKDQMMDVLVQMHFLLPTNNTTTQYTFFLPHWGKVLQWISAARTKLLANLKRSYRKELSFQNLQSQSYSGGLSGKFMVDFLLAQGLVEQKSMPFGTFIKLVETTE